MTKYKTDVCVIGRTLSGLAAAVSAAENGVSVILLDEKRLYNDIVSLEPGPFAVGSRLARENMITLTTKEAFCKIMEHAHWRADATQVHNFVESSAGSIQWLEKMGIQFTGVIKNFPAAEATVHTVKRLNRTQNAEQCMLEQMERYATELGVSIISAAELQQLTPNGLSALRPDGEIELAFTSVVLADEGTEYGRMLAVSLGAIISPVVNMKSAEASNIENELISYVAFRQPSVVCVDLNGNRFINEELLENSAYSGNAFAALPEKSGYSIIDSSIMEHYAQTFFDSISIIKAPSLTSFEQMLQDSMQEAENQLFMANSLDELAQKTGINRNNLLKTVDSYNSRNSEGEDMFYKDKRYKRLLVGPRYYALKLREYESGTAGGVRVSSRYQVLTQPYQPISGVYCAGADACNIYGDSYMPYTPGTILAFAIYSGKKAGQEAADYAVNHG